MMFALKRVGVLRVSKAGELEGLDLPDEVMRAVLYDNAARVLRL